MAIDLTGGLDIAREYAFPERPDVPDMRDAANIWIEEDRGALGMRIGVEAVASQWDAHDIWLDIAFPNGRVISRRIGGTTHSAIGPEGLPTVLGAGPLRFRCVDPFRRWTTSFKGSAAETTTRDLIKGDWPTEDSGQDVEFDIEMNMAAPPWVPGTLLKEAGAILNSGVEGEFMSPRYEQLCRVKGTLRVGDERRSFTGNGLRIRRQGVRKLEGFWGHCWQSAIFPSGRAFGYNTYPPRPDGKPNYNEGYVFDGNGALKPARAIEVPWLSKLVPGGDDVSFMLETEQGRISIQGQSFVNCRSRGGAVPSTHFSPDFPIVQQSHVHYRWDGEETYGMLERSSPAREVTY
jgi:hypothetical protein